MTYAATYLKAAAPIVIAVIGIGLSMLIFVRTRDAEFANAQNALDLRATWFARDVQYGISDAAVPVEALADFIGSQTTVDSREFEGFALAARSDAPISRLGWAPLIKGDERAAFEAAARQSSSSDYVISERGADGRLRTATQRPQYLPIQLGQRFDQSNQQLGFDLMSEAVRKAAIERATRDDRPIATPPLPESFGQQIGQVLTLFWPIHKSAALRAATGQGGASEPGFAIGLYPITSMMNSAIRNTPSIAGTISLFLDPGALSPRISPVAVLSPPAQQFALGAAPLADPPVGGLRLVRSFEQFGRNWTLVFDFPTSVVGQFESPAPWAYLGLGLLLTLSLTAYVAVEQRRRQSVERLVDERTRDLSRTQARLLGIARSIVAGVIVIDANGEILFANPSAHRLLDFAESSLVGTKLDDAFQLLDGGQAVGFADGPFRGVIGTGKTITSDDALFLVRSVRLPVAYACASLEEGGQLAATLSFRSTEALKKAQAESLQASRLASVGQLAAGIAHEINTPIQYVGDNLRFINESLGNVDKAIKGILAYVRQLPDPETAKHVGQLYETNDLEYLLAELPVAAAQSLEGVDRVSHIVRSMKEFSHPGTTAKVATDINRAIASTVTVSTNEWKQVARIETDLAPDLPAVPCFAAEINQVLLNLIVNASHAIEASGGGMGLIRIATRREGAFAEIRVSDSGTGVPEAIRDQIFDPFFTTKPVGRGTGQGLAISLDVVINKHGGQFFLGDSELSGATFVVRLPLDERAVTADEVTT